MVQENTRFLIVGLGLIDGGYAMGLKENSYHVDAVEVNQLSIDYAVRHNIIDRGSTFDTDYIKKADIIASGLYPNMTVDWITTCQEYFRPGALTTDVSSVRAGVVELIQKVIHRDVEFMSSHPTTDKEVSGVKFADDSILHVANFIILLTENNTREAVATVRQFAEILGFSNVPELIVTQRDEMIGFVSHLTHAIAVSLMDTNNSTHLVEYTGNFFRDLTRIAKINENLWSEVLFLGKGSLIREVDNFVQEVNHLKATPEQDDVGGLKGLFIQSTARRRLFDRWEVSVWSISHVWRRNIKVSCTEKAVDV